MKIIVENQKEAVETARKIVEICQIIRGSRIESILQTSYEAFLCKLRDSIEVQNVRA